jgi:hypothetical protein
VKRVLYDLDFKIKIIQKEKERNRQSIRRVYESRVNGSALVLKIVRKLKLGCVGFKGRRAALSSDYWKTV